MVAVVTENLVHGPAPLVVLTTNIQLVTSIAPVAPSRIVSNLPAAHAITRRPHKSHKVEWHVSSLNAIPQLVHSVSSQVYRSCMVGLRYSSCVSFIVCSSLCKPLNR